MGSIMLIYETEEEFSLDSQECESFEKKSINEFKKHFHIKKNVEICAEWIDPIGTIGRFKVWTTAATDKCRHNENK
jgi:hypothetical protein